MANYRPRPEPSAANLALMRRIDELYLEKPFYGSRRMMPLAPAQVATKKKLPQRRKVQ